MDQHHFSVVLFWSFENEVLLFWSIFLLFIFWLQKMWLMLVHLSFDGLFLNTNFEVEINFCSKKTRSWKLKKKTMVWRTHKSLSQRLFFRINYNFHFQRFSRDPRFSKETINKVRHTLTGFGLGGPPTVSHIWCSRSLHFFLYCITLDWRRATRAAWFCCACLYVSKRRR